jgi:uncharacterized phage protein (TIGR02218 family)
MKAASAATLAILAAGQYLKIEAYIIVLANGTTLYFTAGEVALTAGGHTYLTGLTIVRTALSQKTGLEVQTMDMTIEPQADNPAGPITIGGAGFLSACRAGAFDGARITLSKGFFNMPAAGTQLDTSPGLVPWFQGHVNEIQAGRFSVDITVNADLELLNVQMPRNILQSGCVHTLFDAGCTLVKATFTTTGAISGAITANRFNTGLTQANNYFDLGVITFTSGVLNGSTYSVATYLNAGGSIQTIVPFTVAPSAGDTFSIVPGCDKAQATCTTKFANMTTSGGHYRGSNYVPQPETLYDGGTPATAAPALGGQGGGQGAGSSFSGGLGKGSYVP